MINFYPGYKNLCDETIRGGNAYEQSALQRCKLALYASEWAAKTAITNYQVDAAKVKVIPFGANIDCDRTEDDIKTIIKAKTTDKCKLLFIGIDWKRKGGDVAVKVAEELNRSGLKTELIVLGCEPKTEEPLPEFVRTCGFIDKSTSQGRKQFNNLMEESHFLILPTKAECYGLVLCEANSFGVPCLTTDVGGVPTIIKQGLNGKCFDVQADIGLYCRYVCDLFTDYSQYINLSLSAFNEYKTRLNWQVAGKTVKKLVSDIV
jgi:glycosyltransferase involved in cell wall biosynthesis